MATRFLVIQHAEKQPGPGDPGLTGQGEAQARALAESLAGLPVTAVYSSPLLRARRTAEPAGRRLGLAVVVDERLAERANWTGDRPLDEFLASWARSTADRDYRSPGGRSSNEAGHGFEELLRELALRWPDGTVAVVSHGGVTTDLLRNLVGDRRLEELSPGVLESGMPPAGITEVTAVDGCLGVSYVGRPWFG